MSFSIYILSIPRDKPIIIQRHFKDISWIKEKYFFNEYISNVKYL